MLIEIRLRSTYVPFKLAFRYFFLLFLELLKNVRRVKFLWPKPDGFNLFNEHLEILNDWLFFFFSLLKKICMHRIVEVACVHYFTKTSLDMAPSQQFIFYIQFSSEYCYIRVWTKNERAMKTSTKTELHKKPYTQKFYMCWYLIPCRW